MAINEQVYGAKENWIVPSQRTEQGTYISGISYDSTIDEINRIKIANYNTVDNPRTLMRTQMSGDSHSGGYAINNEWLPTQTSTIDKSIVQFGIGPQSGLSNIEWWGEVWASGETQPDTGSHDNVELINSDHYDVTNIAFAFGNTFRPSLYTTSGFMAGNGYMNPANWQYLNRQLWGDSRCFYSSDVDVVPASAYALASLITQIPIKNIKIYPVIRAYNSQMQSNEYSSIQDYIADKANYPFIYCIYAKFTTKVNSSTWASIDVSPWFFNSTSIAKGFGNGDIVRNENIMYLRTRDLSGGFFVIGGCPNFNSQSYYQTNGFYWHYNTASVSFDVAELMPIYQPEDLKFEYDTAKNAFICDVSSMTNDQITEGIRKQLASFGMFFVDDIDDLNLALDDEKTFLGILRNGVGYGDYSNGAKNRDQAQWNWDTMDENEYDPSNPPLPIPDAPTQDDPYSWNSAGTNGANSFRHVYSLSFLNTRNLYNYITSFMNIDTRLLAKNENLESILDPSLTYKAYSQATLDSFMRYVETEFTSDPLSCIVDVIMFPFDLPQYLNLSEIEPVILGYSRAKDRAAEDNFGLALTAVGGRPINGNTIAQINLGSEWIIPKFGDFRDYKPYTTIEITIPYHGTVEIDSAEFMSSQLGVIINVDVCTGLSVAYITKNGVPRISIPGNMGIHIPISGINAQSYYNQMVQRGTEIANTKVDKTKATVGMYSSVFSGAMVGAGIGAKLGTVVPGVGNAAGAILGGSVGAVSGLIKSSASYDKTSNNLKGQEYQYEHMQVSPTQVTNYSSELNIFEMPQCRITYHRCIMNSTFNPTSYGYSVGWATNKSGTVGSFPGYAKFSNAIIVGNMTEEEKALILEKLQDGVIIRNN